MATTNSATVSLKLLIDTKSNKVLFAEASKEVVDFLFTLLSLHVATVTRLLLSNGGMVGCLGKLYESLENLSDTYMQPNLNKDSLLKPKTTISGANILHLQANNDSNAPKWFYLCAMCNRHISDSPVTTCPTCISRKISTQVFYAAPPPEPTGVTSGNIKSGYVKSDIMYIIMDDLEVKPMSTVSSITLLKTLNFKTVDAFEEKVVDLDIEEGLKLVKASLESKTALTNVFLGNKVHEGFNFGPLKKLSFWRFILVCGLTLTVLAYIRLFQLRPSDLIGNKYYTARYGKNDPTSPRKPICFPNDPFALSLIQK
ncbi:unnamed protein product [Prunus brigantina]